MIKIVRQLLKDFHSNNILYCHWKSNEHLEAGLHAETDLDILFSAEQKEEIIRLLHQNHFFLFEAVWYRKYPGIVDYIGFDESSGKIVHIHTHFKLAVGETGIKSYHLPWEDLLLSTRIFNDKNQIYTSSPEAEYLLLLIRTAFKQTHFSTPETAKTAADFTREARWLCKRLHAGALTDLSERMLSPAITEQVRQAYKKTAFDKVILQTLQNQLSTFFGEHKKLSPQKKYLLKGIQTLRLLKIILNKHTGTSFKIKKRHLPNEGIVISIMGADGAGKSTQVSGLIKELQQKTDVVYQYMGSGNGPKVWYRKPVDLLFNLINQRKKQKKAGSKSNSSSQTKELSEKSFFSKLATLIRAYPIALEKRSKLRKIKKDRSKGCIIICDRYPQTSVPGFNDGPLLTDLLHDRFFLFRYAAKKEWSHYRKSEKTPPDIIIKLIGDLSVLQARRPEMNPEKLYKKQAGIRQIHFGEKTWEFVLDIEQTETVIRGRILKIIAAYIADKKLDRQSD